MVQNFTSQDFWAFNQIGALTWAWEWVHWLSTSSIL